MDRVSTINNINKKYKNSIGATQRSVFQGYGSSYKTPVVVNNTITKIGGSIVRQGFESTYAGKTIVPAGFPQQYKVLKTQKVTNLNHNPNITINRYARHQNPVIQTQIHKINHQSLSQKVETPINHEYEARVSRKNFYQNRRYNQICPWWCWLICGFLSFLLLIGFCGGIWAHLKTSKSNDTNIQSSKSIAFKTNNQTQNPKNYEGQLIDNKIQAKEQEAKEETKTQQAKEQEAKEETKTQQAKEQEAKEETKTQQNKLINSNSTSQQFNPKQKVITLSCQNGYYYFNGRCLTCPSQATWNGTNCIKRKQVTVVVSSQSQKTQTAGSDDEQESQNSGNNSTSQNSQQAQKSQQSKQQSKTTQNQSSSNSSNQVNKQQNNITSHHLRSFVD